LKPPADVKITELVINGAECEPYLTADHRMMLECADGILEGVQIAMKILRVSKCLIGIENNKMDAIEAMGKASEGKAGISVCTLKTKYPQGGERQLVYALTGRRIASGALPSSVGVVVQNISTAYAIYEAVVLRKPMYERVMTISGRGIKRQANLRVAVGTRISDIVAYLGGTTDDLEKVILGGPMMGFATSDLSTPVTKTTSGILFLTKDETDLRAGGPCVRCGWCLDACPMGLEPKEIALYVEAGKGKETAQFGVKDCFECGSCAFVCPAKRPLVQLIRLAKKSLPK
jgi:electron transport complex protein RnfC